MCIFVGILININESRVECFDFLESELMTQHSTFPRTAARDTGAGGNSTTINNATHLAARHSTVARKRGRRGFQR